MLVRLTPEQVDKYWDDVAVSVAEALPPTSGSDEAMLNLLESIMNGMADCWVVYDVSEEECKIRIVAYMITTIVTEPISNTKNLLIYALTGTGSMLKEHWKEGYLALINWAKANDCVAVTAYTQLESIVTMAKRLGGDAAFTFVRFPIN